MRDSPWNEHKLIFQEFIMTEGGTALANADRNMLELDWNAIPPSVVSSVSVHPVTLYTGGTASTYALSTDQYGYTLPSQAVSSWVSSNTSIAGVDGAGTVSGHG